MATRESYIIPAAGAFSEIRVDGIAVLVESADIYKQPDEYPTLHFDETTETGLPMIIGTTWPGDVPFRRFYLKGTAASAGATVWLITFDDLCELELIRLNQNLFQRGSVEAGPTFRKESSDISQSLLAAEFTAGQVIASAMTIAVEGADIRIAFGGAVPDQTATPVGILVPAGASRRIVGADFISTMLFISARAGIHANVNFSMEF